MVASTSSATEKLYSVAEPVEATLHKKTSFNKRGFPFFIH